MSPMDLVHGVHTDTIPFQYIGERTKLHIKPDNSMGTTLSTIGGYDYAWNVEQGSCKQILPSSLRAARWGSQPTEDECRCRGGGRNENSAVGWRPILLVGSSSLRGFNAVSNVVSN
ncbi:hypothetical protein GJ744_010755 [Endocarpon pusillum]|uniref:Uncharacterized protein n=1 Tax=Endocarpon pusillum TaxID=364733 RepID=A0A8H7AHT5_9EURO|nr:hypothetical protein GJ744_010755 [Endocarpon pusillum]